MNFRSNPKRLIAALLLAFAPVVVAKAASLAPKRVLLVYQYSGYTPAALEFQQAVFKTLQRASDQNIDFYCEQLDSTRLSESREQAISNVRSRYLRHNIDAVIYSGSVLTDILPGIPTVYVGNSSAALAQQILNPNTSVGVWYKVDVGKTVSAARKLQPQANNVVVITGSGIDDRALREEIRAQLKDLDLPVTYWDGETLNELLLRVSHLPLNTIVIPISYTQDRKGSIYVSREVVTSLARVSTVPIYGVADTYVGAGAVGGYAVDFRKTGEVVADAILQLLRGIPSAQVSIPAGGTGAYIFDWAQMKRWNFSEKELPQGSVVRFRTYSVWEQYRWRIIATIAIIVAQFFLILRLLVTRRKQIHAEAGLREMTGRLMQAQEEERRRFARDLHDGTGQHLSAMALAIGQVLAKFPAGYESLRKLLQDSHSASRLALEEVRTVSFALHPPLLDGLGLAAAVRWYLDGLQRRTKLRVYFDSPERLNPLTSETERALFRIVQESVGNVLHHSRGSTISVVLSNRDNTVALEIKDDGRGMTEEELAQAEGTATLGVGIAGMRERLRQLHGAFKIQSNSTGTKVIATVPSEEEHYAAHSIG